MKKTVVILILISILSGCSGLPVSIPFLQTQTPTSPPQPTATPFSLDPTFTPDLFVLNTLPPTTTAVDGGPAVSAVSTPTGTPFIIFTPTTRATITLEPLSSNLFTPAPSVFLGVHRSTDLIVWGSACEGARSIRFTAQVQPARGLRYVTLWYRLQDKYSSRHTNWGGGAIMSDNDQGTYFYDLDLSQIARYRFYQDAWLQYQLVASTATERVLGRTAVSRSDVSLRHCSVINP
ncbi:MAG TPA: hypothetical protein VK900_02265 [Anaerolineales bacterium]|nr:hypothetical protein [Anaerolineales bacterium]